MGLFCRIKLPSKTLAADRNACLVKLQRMSLHHPRPVQHPESGTCGETGLGGTAQTTQQGSAVLGEEARIASLERSCTWACLLSWGLTPEAGALLRM